MVVGLTGGIGSGKSTIAKALQLRGYAVYDTDSRAKEIIVSDAKIREDIIGLLGEDAYQGNVYQSQVVAQKVFADRSLLAKLNAIIHPAVREDIVRWSKHYEDKICIVECAILYTSGIYRLCDKIVAVDAPENIRLQRAMDRDNTSVNKVRARMRAQEDELRMQQADVVVYNDGKLSINDICEKILQSING